MGKTDEDRIYSTGTRVCHVPVVFLPSPVETMEHDSQGVLTLYLPLYLVLLAFFVMLTVNGTFDKPRGTDVLRSVNGALAGVVPLVREQIDGEIQAREIRARVAAVRIEEVLGRHGFEATRVKDWYGALVMKAQISSLFQEQDVRFDPDHKVWLSRLAEFLADVPGAEVAFLIGDGDPLAMKRAVFLDDNWPLIAPHIPADIGILPGGEGLTIRVDMPDLA